MIESLANRILFRSKSLKVSLIGGTIGGADIRPEVRRTGGKVRRPVYSKSLLDRMKERSTAGAE